MFSIPAGCPAARTDFVGNFDHQLAADGWQKANSPATSPTLNAVESTHIAARKALESVSRARFRREDDVLAAAAVLDIVGFMFFDFGIFR